MMLIACYFPLTYFQERKPKCEYGAWEDWSKCSTTFGPGTKSRQRHVLTTDCLTDNKTEWKQNEDCTERYTSTLSIFYTFAMRILFY